MDVLYIVWRRDERSAAVTGLACAVESQDEEEQTLRSE